MSDTNNCPSCNPPAALNCQDEPIQSQIDNFILSFVGTITKTAVNGVCIWALPCNLGDEIPAFPRLPNEGVLCYLYRIIATGAAVGEANTGANVGAGTGLPFRDKTGITLNFRSLLEGLNVNIANGADDITIEFVFAAVPAGSGAPGTPGQLAYGGGFFYVCTGLNQWGRIAIANTWP